MVNLGRDSVAIYGAPIFSKEGKGPGFPSKEFLDQWTPDLSPYVST